MKVRPLIKTSRSFVGIDKRKKGSDPADRRKRESGARPASRCWCEDKTETRTGGLALELQLI